ncbi:PAS domain S-box protein [Sphingomonas morindae]|uniref:histidine kinase n=1 Tax=Sphingomonas morindae TaxID=1541170 RepID=A0ABY4XA72_9SPHN|nr:PAS domain S-box protein [Sphingomonas morindae]USI73799.1 PAS domain S-box protein [Sphingomonas morindae]
MLDRDDLLRRQHVLAEFGEFVLRCDDLQTVLTEACRLISEALGTGLAKVLEIEPGGETAVVRAGVGWAANVVGTMRIPLDEQSSETFAIEAGAPVIARDVETESRFSVPDFMRAHGVAALVNVPIRLPGGRAFGLLQVDAREPRQFGAEDIEFLRTYAMVLGPVIDRLHKMRDLEDTMKRYRMIVEHARDYAIFLSDPEDRITDWLPGAEAVFGWTEAEARGRSAEILFLPEDRAAGVPRQEIARALRDGTAPDIRWHLRKNGERVFIDGRTIAVRDGARLTGFMKIGQDMTERRRSEDALRTNEARLRLALETARLGAWDWDMVGNHIEWSDEHFRLQGYSVGGVTPSFEAWAERIHPEDRAEAERALLRARDERIPYVAEFRTVHPDGTTLWCSASGRFFYDEQGRPIRMIGAMQDITERRQWADRQQVLVGELQHRTRNLMSVVRSIAEKTVRASTGLEDFRDRFRDRLDALARVQQLLSRLQEGERVRFDELIRHELDAMQGIGTISLDGPSGVRLRSSTVQMLAMGLHELATNAMKYGALGQAGARLSVTWRYEPDGEGGEPWLHIRWREEGVAMPAADAPAAGTGQGRELIERALPYQLGAQTRYRLEKDGLDCCIALPVSRTKG